MTTPFKASIFLPILVLTYSILSITPLLAQTPSTNQTRFSDLDSLEQALSQALSTMVAKQFKPQLRTALAGIYYGHEETGGPLTPWFEDVLTSSALRQNTPGTRRITLLGNRSFSRLDPGFIEVYRDVFSADNTEAYLVGSYLELDQGIQLQITLTDLGSGEVLGQQRFLLDRQIIPQARPAPANHATADALREVIERVVPTQTTGPTASFSVAITTSRGAGAVYTDGENLELLFSTTKDAWVRLYHIDVNGTATLIFPNPFSTTNKVLAGSLVRIPGTGYGAFTFALHAPFGTEYIKAVASVQPFTDNPQNFVPLGKATAELLARGLSVRNTQTETAEALVSYTIIPKR